MKKSTLLFAIALALFSGCEGGKKESASLVQIAATAGASAVEARAPGAPPELRKESAQPISAGAPASTILGERTYKGTCSICHKTGLNGAPRMGDNKDWGQRVAQGKETLYGHAINGYRGSKGSMPPRGGNLTLSDGEVKAAVDFMLEGSDSGAR